MSSIFQIGRLNRLIGTTLLGLCGALTATHANAQAQAYPNKPIKFVVPYSAGTTTDVIARLYAQKLGEILGQSIVVDN